MVPETILGMEPVAGIEAKPGMVEFSMKPDVTPSDVWGRFSKLRSDFFDSLTPLEQSQYNLLLSTDKGNDASGSLGEFAALFTNGSELMKLTGVKAFDKAQTIREGLPVDDQVAMLAGLECMAQDILDKRVFYGQERDSVYAFKVQLRNAEKQAISGWLQDNGRADISVDEVVSRVGSVLTGRQRLAGAALAGMGLLNAACGVSPQIAEIPQYTAKALASPVGIQTSDELPSVLAQETTPTAAYEPTLLPTDKA